ncbi:MAG: type II toxin-antitoxin system RelE/ParE family toxin [Erysipelotrichaceae bacterium]|nr:type II toxin-antitoxin system RelE/ParE family toxin [Erysipelotrichaceae bacterium]
MSYYEVIITDQALRDLEDIFEYIAVKFHSPSSAKKTIQNLFDAIRTLDMFPEGNRRYPEEPWRSRNLRVMTVGKYCVLYYPDNDNLIVRVSRVIYGRRDIGRILRETSEFKH